MWEKLGSGKTLRYSDLKLRLQVCQLHRDMGVCIFIHVCTLCFAAFKGYVDLGVGQVCTVALSPERLLIQAHPRDGTSYM